MSRSLSDDLRNPNLFSEYKAGEYEYETNAAGCKSATGSLKIAEAPERDNKAQAAAGGESRRGKDHEWGADDGGHLIGARFGGGTGEENLTAQSRNLNRSDYKQMENEWASHLEAGDKVFVHIETDDPQRPNAYMGYVIYESPDGKRDWDAFHMVNESRSEVARWDEEAAEWEDWDDEADYGQSEDPTADLEPAGEDTANEYLGSAASESASSADTQTSGSGMESDSSMGYD